jgi:hypothetical protein
LLFLYLQSFTSVLTQIYLFLHTDHDHCYNRLHLIFIEQYPEVKSFDIYHPSWEYLKDAPKFQSIIIELNSVSKGVNNNDETEVAKSTIVIHGIHVMGTKKAKRLVDEEKM